MRTGENPAVQDAQVPRSPGTCESGHPLRQSLQSPGVLGRSSLIETQGGRRYVKLRVLSRTSWRHVVNRMIGIAVRRQ